jgi:hypothetical protein
VPSLDPGYWVSKVGTGYTPTGTTVRDLSSGTALTLLRTRLATDGAVQTNVNTNTAGCIPAIYYRVDPTDANYGANTGQCYQVTISGTTVTASYRASGGSLTTLGTLTLANGAGTNTVFCIRADYVGGKHHIEIFAPSNEIQTLDFYDFSFMGAGYSGIGYSGTGGGFFNVGTIGNKSQGTIFEFADRPPSFGALLAKSDLLGVVNDFSSNADSYGGNSINHLSGPGTKIVYEPALQNLLVKLAAN